MTFEKGNKHGAKYKATAEQWELARKLKAEGLTGKEIARQVGLTPGRISQVLGQRRTKSEPQS